MKEEDLPTFHGKLNPDECMDWLEALDNHFECDKVPISQRFKLAIEKVKGPALSWWNFLQNEREDEGKDQINTWKRMKAKIKKKFIS